VMSIIGGNFEGSARFLVTGGPAGASLPFTISNVRWATGGLHADRRMIIYQFPGPLLLLNNSIEPYDANKATEIQWINTAGAAGQFIAVGNYISSTLAQPFTGTPPTFQAGNQITPTSGAPIVTPTTTSALTVGTLTGVVRGATGVLSAAELSGDVATLGSNVATLATKLRTRSCMIPIGLDNGPFLTNADLTSQFDQCTIDVPMTVREIRVSADAGTPSVIVHKRTIAGSVTALLSGALATAAGGAVSCAKPTATPTTSYDGSSTCTLSVQNNTALPAGTTLGLTSGSASTSKRVSIVVTMTVD
jgi:hypothetical protein